MSRYAKDPALTKLANELKSIAFTAAPDLESDTSEKLEHFARGVGDYPFRLVYSMPNFRTWAVRLFLGGSVRTIGYTDNLCAACRFADMAALRFWKYKIRGACEPLDANLNFGVAQAKHDSVHETGALVLLDKIENYLQEYLGDPQQAEVDRKLAKKARDARRTVRSDFHELIGQLSDKIDRLEKKIDQLGGPRVWDCGPFKHTDKVDMSRPNPDWVDACLTCEQPITECKCAKSAGVVKLENLFDSKPKT